MQVPVIVGVDVSKSTLDYTWLPDGKAKHVTNTTRGIATLIKEIQKVCPQITVLEATGGYQNNFVAAMHEAGLPVKVVNPRQVRDFARSLNRLGKTDALDARTLAEFGQSRKLIADRPKVPQLAQISYLLKRRDQIQDMITAEKSHLEHTPEKYQKNMRELIDILLKHLHAADKEIKEIMSSNPDFATKDAIIQSIPGVGPVTAATLIAELPELSALGRKQACALVGVAPFNRDSGKYRGQRHIWAGRSQIRKVLYCAIRPCLRFNPTVNAWFERFRKAGKPYKVAVVACMRKLLVIIRSMLISVTQWEQKKPIIS